MSDKKIGVGSSGFLLDCGMVLLGRRAEDDNHYPGMWCSPGGKVEFGESTGMACNREFLEEVGLEVNVTGAPFHIDERVKGDRHTILFFYEVKLAKPIDMRHYAKPLDGFSDVWWFNPTELLQLVRDEKVTPATAAAIQQFIASKNDFEI